MTKDEARLKIIELVKKYEQVIETRSISKYTEEETKKDFIQPLFHALGWDTQNKNEVTAEEHHQTGRPDYGFYLNGRCKFFVEAKALKTNLHNEEFANQAVRYSWNKGVTWAVLTDFESMKVFNAQVIDKSLFDKLFFEIKYTEYVDRFDQLWLLSKESFENSLLDAEGEKFGKKLQKVSVSELLYKDLSECRRILTNDLGQWNKDVDKDLLDEGVQKLLDRLIFLRVAEDRGIEQKTLIPMVREWQEGGSKKHLYESMIQKFRELDDIYNSGLFSEHPFEKWEEYSGATEKVIKILYGKAGYYEYDFKAMPVDVLGGVYENYLGYRLAKSKKGLSIDKDATKRKEQGIYYTPDFIVDYIVKNTLKPVLDKCNSIEDLKKIKVLDPACGSGSFLLKALEVIHNKYIEFGSQGGTFTKIDILLNNIYGVDLDNQAVEIARLNLLISALDTRMKLPSLDKNIKNGNSLISGTDEELKKYFGKNYRDKKPFNWQEEFPEVFNQGGFDVIIGNPPYVFARGGNFDDNEKQYFYDKYILQQYQLNTYLLFIEKGYELLKESCNFGYIVPNNWLTINTFSKLREFIINKVGNVQIINAVDTVFSQASVDSCLLMFSKIKPTTISLGELRDGQVSYLNNFQPDQFNKNNFVLNIKKDLNVSNDKVIDIVNSNSINLITIADVKSGLVAYEVGKGNPAQSKEMKNERIYHSKEKVDNDWIKYLDGVNVGRYILGWSGEYIKYGKNLSAPRVIELFSEKRILVRQIPSQPPYCINAVYLEDQYINDRNSNNILKPKTGYSLKYILGVINSRLVSYWFVKTFDKFQRKIFPQFKVNELGQFPIYDASKDQQKAIINLVDKMLDLNKIIKQISENSEKWLSIKSEIEKVNNAIDQEVYKLYGLSSEEIEIVKNGE